MIKCSHCGYENSDNLDYCINCSKRLPIKDDSIISDNLNDLYYSSVEDINLKNNYNTPPSLNGHNILNDDKLFISTIISMIIPGSGLIYLKQQRIGLIFLFTTIFLWILTQVVFSVTKTSIVNITFSISLILYFINIIYTFKIAEEDLQENIR